MGIYYSFMQYGKVIGNNFGAYPYRVGLNTLMDEPFNPDPGCGPGGLYYCELKDAPGRVGFGDKLCIVKPVGVVVPVGNKFKTDRLIIEEIMDLAAIDTWRFLVAHGADVRAGEDRALRWAAEKGHLDIVKFLVEHGADIHGKLVTNAAARHGQLEVMKFLVERDVVKDIDTALWWAQRGAHIEVVRYLSDRGATLRPHSDPELWKLIGEMLLM